MWASAITKRYSTERRNGGESPIRTALNRSGQSLNGHIKALSTHKMNPKHLQRYINEFAERNNIRDLAIMAQMKEIVARMAGKYLMYKDLIG